MASAIAAVGATIAAATAMLRSFLFMLFSAVVNLSV
jgi:hypothetical protein